MPAPSEYHDQVRVGFAGEVVDAVSRSYLGDGRVVGWYGDRRWVVDAEVADRSVPQALAARYGVDAFWERWTRAECGAKLADRPIALWLSEHGLTPGPYRVATFRLDDVIVSIGSPL